MRYILKENQYKFLLEQIEVPENKMLEFEELAKKEFEQIQEKINKVKNNIKIYQSGIENIESALKGTGASDELIKTLKADLKNKFENEKISLDYLEKQTYETILNRMINRYKQVEQEKLDKIERLKGKEITKENLIDLFVTALEGGSNNWYYILNVPNEVREIMKTDNLALSEAIGEFVLKGGEVEIRDVESIDFDKIRDEEYSDTGEILGYVNIDSLLDAINIIKKDYPDTYENILDENYDAIDADIFFQIATMGEIVFG